jgi:ferredoxin
VRYLVDQALCCGHGQCAALAPEVYSLDDDGINKEAGHFADVEPGQEETARAGALACPDAAIRLFDEPPGRV